MPRRSHDEEPSVSRRSSPAESARDARTGGSAGAGRAHDQHRWVDLQVREAIARGDFEGLPGFGRPIADLGTQHDPDWWIKRLVERERISGVLPPALALRTEDAELDARLDLLSTAAEVRERLEDFNERVRRALYQPLGGPPLVTQQRDVEAEVRRWQERRAARWSETAPPATAQPGGDTSRARRRPWWRRRRR